MKKSKIKQFALGICAAFAVCVLIMLVGGVTSAETDADRLKAVCDGFSMGGLLVLCVTGMVWISQGGSFDILTYAFKRAAHMLIPGRGKVKFPSYFDYKLEKSGKRKPVNYAAIMLPGLVCFIIGLVLIAVWYSSSPA